MAFVRRLPVRFADVDYARVVYYPRFFDFTHQVFEDFFEAEVKVSYRALLQDRGIGFPTVHAEADFRAPLRFGDVARIELATTKVGGRSLTCRYQFFKGDEAPLCAQLTVVTAAIDMKQFSPTDLPSDVAQAFARHQVQA